MCSLSTGEYTSDGMRRPTSPPYVDIGCWHAPRSKNGCPDTPSGAGPGRSRRDAHRRCYHEQGSEP